MSGDDVQRLDALADMRARHEALVALVLSIDQKAHDLLKFYVTLGIGGGASIAPLLLSSNLEAKSVGFALIAVVLCLVVGSLFCLKASGAAEINLPGKGAEFWAWAIKNEIPDRDILLRYAQDLEDRQAKNRSLNGVVATALATAKGWGIAAGTSGIAVGLIAFLSLSLNEASADQIRSSGCPNQSVGAEVAD